MCHCVHHLKMTKNGLSYKQYELRKEISTTIENIPLCLTPWETWHWKKIVLLAQICPYEWYVVHIIHLNRNNIIFDLIIHLVMLMLSRVLICSMLFPFWSGLQCCQTLHGLEITLLVWEMKFDETKGTLHLKSLLKPSTSLKIQHCRQQKREIHLKSSHWTSRQQTDFYPLQEDGDESPTSFNTQQKTDLENNHINKPQSSSFKPLNNHAHSLQKLPTPVIVNKAIFLGDSNGKFLDKRKLFSSGQEYHIFDALKLNMHATFYKVRLLKKQSTHS